MGLQMAAVGLDCGVVEWEQAGQPWRKERKCACQELQLQLELEQIKLGLEFAKNQGELGAKDQKSAHRGHPRAQQRESHCAGKLARTWICRRWLQQSARR